MNQTHRTIYNHALGAYTAVAETAKSGGKGKRAAVVAQNPYPLARITLALLISLGGLGQQAMAGPISCDQTGSKFKCGAGAVATKNNTTAVGKNATASGVHATAVGKSSTAEGTNTVAVGVRSHAEGAGTVAIGKNAHAGTTQNNQSIAVGFDANASGDQAIALGANTRGSGFSSIAIGGDDLDRVATDFGNLPVFPSGAPSDPRSNTGFTYAYTAAESAALNNSAAATRYQAISGGDLLVNYSVPGTGAGKRFTSTESGHGAVAVGVMSTANDLATSFGTRANAYGVASLALGVGAQTGRQNTNEGDGAIANGAGSKAYGQSSIATGAGSKAYNKSDIAIGDGAVAGTDGNNGLFDNKAIAIGTGAQATGKQSISIGTGNIVTGDHSGAFGDPSIINGKNSYSIGNNNKIAAGVTTGTFVMGNDVNATVDNSVYLGNKTTVTAGNAVGTKNLTQAGVAGATTTAGDKGTVNSATVGGVTYGGFAGATADGAVSVGAAGSERRVQNVAAGEISATSTDAINGSQLYSVAKNLGGKINNVAKDANAGTASAMALAGLPQAFTPGKKMVAMGGATYRGEQAIAASISTVSDNGKWVLKGMVSHSSRGHTGGTVGVGYQW